MKSTKERRFSIEERMYLERYADWVEDWEACLEAMQRPLPLTLWIDRWRAPEEVVCEHLYLNGFSLTPVSWRPETYHYQTKGVSAGNSFAYRAGLIHLQESIALTAVDSLNLPNLYNRAVERNEPFLVLDLCSAPGNKTVQAATILRQVQVEGVPFIIVANDVDYRRLRAVRGALDRLGHVNVAITEQNAAEFKWNRKFDVVIADVPCGCEGTVRKNSDAIIRAATKDSSTMVRLQKQILRRALGLIKSDGVVVYSTCTLAPEENEGVVDGVLKQCPEFEVVPFESKARSSQGFTTWKDCRGEGGEEVTFDKSLVHSKRYWPHMNDSGGFYTAVIKRQRTDHFTIK